LYKKNKIKIKRLFLFLFVLELFLRFDIYKTSAFI